MRNSNGSNADEISKNLISPNSSEQEFVENLKLQGIEELVKSLKMVHDLALYQTSSSIDTPEKTALFNLKLLWEELEELRKC